jgi:hypothetical protein
MSMPMVATAVPNAATLAPELTRPASEPSQLLASSAAAMVRAVAKVVSYRPRRRR